MANRQHRPTQELSAASRDLIHSQQPSRDPKPKQSTQDPSKSIAHHPKTASPSKRARKRPRLESKPIYSFFAATDQSKQGNDSRQSGSQSLATAHESSDSIQDSSSDADISHESGRDGRRTLKEPDDDPISRTHASLNSNISSQRFRRTEFRQPIVKTTSKPVKRIGNKTWAEKYCPTGTNELAVHKKKIEQVRNWLVTALSGRDRKKLLVLQGPAGCGKTTTFSLLSREIGFDVNEWTSPNASGGDSTGYTSISAQFEDFLRRAGKFNALDFDSLSVSTSAIPVNSQREQKQVILIEEFPSTITASSPALLAFRSAVRNFLAADSESSRLRLIESSLPPTTPIVIIISETMLDSDSTTQAFNAHRLLGVDILTDPLVEVIEFNRIAPTIMLKALELVVIKEAREFGRRKTPGAAVLNKLAEIGDIRNAISCLEFLCLRGDVDNGWSGRVTFSKPRKGKANTALTEMETDSLKVISNRETTLDIFHAAGKILYNKREEPKHDKPIPQPPLYLPGFVRSKITQTDVNELLRDLGTDTQILISTLHENYLPSCNSSSENELDILNGCIDSLSDADILFPGQFTWNSSAQWANSSGVRQDEISFQTGARGMLFHLPHPVNRSKARVDPLIQEKNLSTSNVYQMMYPFSLKMLRLREESDEAINLLISHIYQRSMLGNVPGAIPNTSLGPLVGGSNSVKREFILDRVPYMGLTTCYDSTVETMLEKISQFRGDHRNSKQSRDTQSRTQFSFRTPSVNGVSSIGTCVGDPPVSDKKVSIHVPLEREEGKLILSEDDIEDDE